MSVWTLWSGEDLSPAEIAPVGTAGGARCRGDPRSSGSQVGEREAGAAKKAEARLTVIICAHESEIHMMKSL